MGPELRHKNYKLETMRLELNSHRFEQELDRELNEYNVTFE